MPKDKDNGKWGQEEFSLDDILAEFATKKDRPAQPPQEVPSEEERDWREDTIPFPVIPRDRKEVSLPRESEDDEDEGEDLDKLIAETIDSAEDEEEELPPEPTKLLEFPPQEPENAVEALRRKADEFAEHMFEEEGREVAKSTRRAERLIPGVDEEAPPPPSRVKERKRRPAAPPPPDIPPAELAKQYVKGLKGARLRLTLAFVLLIPQLYLTLFPQLPYLGDYLPFELTTGLKCYIMAALQGCVLLLGIDAFFKGLSRPFRGGTGMDTLCALANIAILADALTLPTLAGTGSSREPFCAVGALSLWCVMWGNLQKRRGQRLACRTAASTTQPYLVTRDEGKWNGRDTYIKWLGPVSGFGSQVQAPDGAEAIYRVIAPLLILAAVLFALISSVGHHKSGDLLWCLAAILAASTPLSATLCFGRPWRRLSRRLAKTGAALAGWQGVVNTTGSANLILTDIDLFPAGAVSLNGVKVFGDFSVEKVIGVTATVIRDGGSGLEKVFHDLLRSQGAIYRQGSELTAHEGGGLSEVIRGELVQVGSAPFMVLMNVTLPPGLKVKNAVFCAIDGELAGIFALNYHLPGSVPLAVDSLIHNKITPVLATRDFNLIPSMLRQRFKLPADRMEFPSVERRRELSAGEQDHSDTLTAVLCREGLGPYAEAVVGAKRLRVAVRLSAILACLGSAAGALLSFYLTFVSAYASLTPGNLLVFLGAWLVPLPLISGWVDRY